MYLLSISARDAVYILYVKKVKLPRVVIAILIQHASTLSAVPNGQVDQRR